MPSMIVMNKLKSLLNLTNTADSSGTIDVGEWVSVDALGCIIGIEVGYSSLPSSPQEVSLRVRQYGGTTDYSKVWDQAGGSEPSSDIAMVQVFIPFNDPKFKKFDWVINSTDAAVTNKRAIIDLHGYF